MKKMVCHEGEDRDARQEVKGEIGDEENSE